METTTKIKLENDFGGGGGYPERFRVSEYEVAWLDSGDVDENGRAIGGSVSIRVARTGDPDADWMTSDNPATLLSRAIEVARGLIDEYEDSLRE